MASEFKRGYLYYHTPSMEYYICHLYDGRLLLTGLSFSDEFSTDTLDAGEETGTWLSHWKEVGPLGDLNASLRKD